MKVGERAPLYAVSSGKIALSKMSSAEFDDYLRTLTFDAITPHTITSKRRLREEMPVVRQSGFAYSREEFTPGITGNSKDSFIDTLSIRGILTNDFGVGGDPSVGVFKNDLYQGRNGAVQ